MEFKNLTAKPVGFPRNHHYKREKWFDKRIVLGKYSYSVRNLTLMTLSVAAIVLFAAFSANAYQKRNADSNVATQREIRSLTMRIGRSMELPQGEQPALATVTDKGKLKGQEFFSRAQNGDKLLIYPKARKAILWRPLTEKIIDVTNITSGGQSNSQPVPLPLP